MFGVGKEGFFAVLKVKNGEPHDREWCEEDVVIIVQHWRIDGDTRIETEYSKEENWKHKYNILVKVVGYQIRVSPVTLPAMNK